ncbi:Glutaminyl-tRNA synthetase [Candidatus Riesia pediculischaeffi PTSU]|uniref:50S ribosomal protein L25 n=1 Tax=Candidatus Riesia pediculischaeffi PTSU TaxID=1401651 RepID=A0A0C1V7Q0_9ENTR|nr:Glutaminyl-tRNA synthetase [Candidatus Riesia pediculischaeffi PTSU]
MFDHLFKVPNPGENFLELINENSMILKMGFVEPEILSFKKGQHFQLEREGYFCIDADSNYVKNLKLTINHIVSLK